MKSNILILFLGILCLTSSSQKVNKEDIVHHPFQGRWLVSMHTNDVGTVQFLLDVNAKTDTTFVAYSRKKAANKLIGGIKTFLAQTFSDSFKKGAFLHLYNGKIKKLSNSYEIKAILSSPLGKVKLEGILTGNEFKATLSRKGKKKGTISGNQHTTTLPLRDYPIIIKQALELTKQKIYNKSTLATSEWIKFEKKVTKFAASAQDDLDIIFGFFYFADKLPFSHYFLYQSTQDNEEIADDEKEIELKEISTTTAHLKIKSFAGESSEIDSFFNLVKLKNYDNLIIDLRGNTGGNISGMKVATNIAQKEFYGGIFLTNQWFEKHNLPPDISDYKNFPLLTEANLSLLWDGIHNELGLCLKVIPEKEIYTGNVFILTDTYTASTCEPLVYGLKQYQLATIVGEKTAGSMLNGEEFSIADKWKITIPTADYYTSDGVRLDQTGVKPTIEVPSKEALDYVLINLIDN